MRLVGSGTNGRWERGGSWYGLFTLWDWEKGVERIVNSTPGRGLRVCVMRKKG